MEHLLQLIAGILMSAITLGLILKLLFVTMNILSIPLYIGLMTVENVFRSEILKINHPPKSGFWKLIMNTCASLLTLMFIENFVNFFKLIPYTELLEAKLINGEIISSSSSWMILVCLTIIYTINFFSEKDNDDNFSKIDKTDIKPFLKIW